MCGDAINRCCMVIGLIIPISLSDVDAVKGYQAALH